MSALLTDLRRGDSGRFNQWLSQMLPRSGPDRYSLAVILAGSKPIPVPALDERIYGFGCLQDTMLAVLACLAHDRGLMSLEANLANHLDGLPVSWGRQPIQIKHLLSRSTGLWLPDPKSKESPVSNWDEWLGFVSSGPAHYRLGKVASHSLLDRIFLVEVLARVFGRCPYEILRQEYWPHSQSIAFVDADAPLNFGYKDIRGSMADLSDFVALALQGSWPDRLLSAETAFYAGKNSPIKEWAPHASAMGLFRACNGVWGQDGDDPVSGHLAVRIDLSTRAALVGRFASAAERDFLLATVFSEMAGLSPPARDYTLGTLAGLEPETVCGAYEGMFGQRLSLQIANGKLLLGNSAIGDGVLPIDMMPDGKLAARWAGQTLWLEPCIKGQQPAGALHFGRQLYIRQSGDQQSQV